MNTMTYTAALLAALALASAQAVGSGLAAAETGRPAATAAEAPSGQAGNQDAKPAAGEPEDDPTEILQKRVKALETELAALRAQVAGLAAGHRVVGSKHVFGTGSARIEVSPMGVVITSPTRIRISSGGDIEIDSRAQASMAGSRGLDLRGSRIKLNGGNEPVLRGRVRVRNTCIPDRSTGSFRCADGIVEPGSYSRSVFVD